MERLQNDPKWVAEDAARKAEWAETAAQITAEQAELVRDLRGVGLQLDSIWDLVNTTDSYPEAIPVLLDHASRPYATGPYSWRIREAILRALTVPEARGEPAWRILREFEVACDVDAHVRWGFANALQVVADASMVGELERLQSIEHDEKIGKMLRLAAVKAAKRKVRITRQ